MKKSLALLFAAAMPVLAVAQSAPYIQVSGHAERMVQPDRFTIDIVVEVVDMKPVVARNRVEQHMAKVLAGFRAQHALADSISASTISIGPHQSYKNSEEVFDGTAVTRHASATFGRMDDLRAFIDGLDTAGKELQITQVKTARSDAEAIDSQLRDDAMRQSRVNAERIAKAYGATLGQVFTVSDQAPRTYDSNALDSVTVSASKLRPDPIDLQVGEIKLERSIYATFYLEPEKR